MLQKPCFAVGVGHKFQAIAQQNIEDTRALTNWAKSICIRASLKDQPEVCSCDHSPMHVMMHVSVLLRLRLALDTCAA